MEPDKDKTYTYEELSGMDIEGQWEFIDGVFYAMSPSPTPSHQDDVLTISANLYNQLKGSDCKAFVSHMDVLLK